MHWYFRDISDDPSEKELTQLDQFNNDEVALAEALVRETIQNSTDARADVNSVVRVHFSIVQPASERHQQTFRNIITGLVPHLTACEFSIPISGDPLQLLVIEDFGTTGLTGSVEEKDDKQFSGFWRRFGRSNKKEGAKGGRWGLGKLVFPSASEVRSVIGLTKRTDEKHEWIMGQAVLRNHSINGIEHDSVGFWCRSDATRKGTPSDDQDLCRLLTEGARLSRRDEPGLSLIIPFSLNDITAELLLAATIKNYYFPILTESLVVSIGNIEISAATFDSVASSLVTGTVSPSLLDFVRHIQNCRALEPDLVLSHDWQEHEKGITGELLGVDKATSLRERFLNDGLLFIRAPFYIEDKARRQFHTNVDLFFKRTQPGERGQTLVVRGSITVPMEGKRSTFIDCNAALIADDEAISRLLGDAENPSHTQWNERAEKLRDGWQSGWRILRRIRAALHELHELITERVEKDDQLALVEFFSIPKADRGRMPHRPTVGRPSDLPPTKPKPFRIEKRKGGFAILPATITEGFEFPLTIRILCAYDVLSGNPYKRFSDLDFDLFRAHRGNTRLGGTLSIIQKDADCYPTEPNRLDVIAQKPSFAVEVVGFDQNRDLVIEAEL